jgi:hypothetical protein
MKATALALIVLYAAAPQVWAQETPEQAALIHKGNAKIWTGVILICAGAMMIPATITTESDKSPVKTAGIGLVLAGGPLILLGARDHRKATRPQTTYGVVVGKTTGIEISHRW